MFLLGDCQHFVFMKRQVDWTRWIEIMHAYDATQVLRTICTLPSKTRRCPACQRAMRNRKNQIRTSVEICSCLQCGRGHGTALNNSDIFLSRYEGSSNTHFMFATRSRGYSKEQHYHECTPFQFFSVDKVAILTCAGHQGDRKQNPKHGDRRSDLVKKNTYCTP